MDTQDIRDAQQRMQHIYFIYFIPVYSNPEYSWQNNQSNVCFEQSDSDQITCKSMCMTSFQT